MDNRIFTLENITAMVKPLAEKYHVKEIYLFGSYARGEATAESDIDLLVDLNGSTVEGLCFVSLYLDLEAALESSIDLVTVASLDQPTKRRSQHHFRETVKRERMMIYAAA